MYSWYFVKSEMKLAQERYRPLRNEYGSKERRENRWLRRVAALFNRLRRSRRQSVPAPHCCAKPA